jgi:hypothetical protein
MLNNLTRESHTWDISIGMRQDILDIKVNISYFKNVTLSKNCILGMFTNY